MNAGSQITTDGDQASLERRVESLEQAKDALQRLNADLQEKVRQLEHANVDARKSRLATLNVLEDATASRLLA
jgi:uncharacterized protein YlxW (UPF0749 family)